MSLVSLALFAAGSSPWAPGYGGKSMDSGNLRCHTRVRPGFRSRAENSLEHSGGIWSIQQNPGHPAVQDIPAVDVEATRVGHLVTLGPLLTLLLGQFWDNPAPASRPGRIQGTPREEELSRMPALHSHSSP